MRVLISEILEGQEPTADVPVKESDVALALPEELGSVRALEDVVLSFSKETEGHLSIAGDGKAKLVCPCSRCLKDVDVEVPISFEEEFKVEEDEVLNDPEDPLDALTDGVLDVDVLVLSEIIRQLPTKVLCREDCKGLCPKCGQDLNVAECGCDRFVPDPRMQKIFDVFSGN